MNKNYTYKFARFVSDILMPPFFSLLSFTYLTLVSFENFSDGLFIYLISILTSVIIPIIIFVIARKSGKLKDRDASIREQRTMPLLLSILQMFLFIIVLFLMQAPIIFIAFLSVYILVGLIVILINLFYKISIHTLNGAGSLALFSFYSFEWCIVISILLIILMWSRYYLKMHTIMQILSGLVLGYGLSYIIISLFLYI